MGFEIISRSAKLSYEEYKLLQEGKSITEMLFPSVEPTENAAVLLDTYTSSPYGAAYVEPGSKSIVRTVENGSGTLISPPVASEKTPIDSATKDLAFSGAEVTESYMTRLTRIMDRTMKQHVEAHNMTKYKQALDVIRTGEFVANGVGGKDLGLSITFSRDAANSMTYDTTATGATAFAALKKIETQARAQGTPVSNFVVLCGSDWLDYIATDKGVIEYMQANPSASLINASMVPPKLQGVYGLTVHMMLRPLGMLAPVYICSYQPDTEYIAYEGATAAPWIPATEAVAFSLSDKRYTVQCGVDVLDGNGKAVRTVGDVVFDTFTENDPVADYIRSQRREIFVPANINHTFRLTGTFA